MPCGASRASFGSSSTAEQVTEGIDATHITAIVTGSTNGIGMETARVLALRGATVIIPARSMESGLKVKESLLRQNPSARLEVMEMDLSSLDSVESFAHRFNSTHRRLNLLVNNAGIMACPFQLSEDGVEMQFATNFLGPFLLTNLLLEKMKTTAKESGVQGRVVNVSSEAHRHSHASWLNLNVLNDPKKYTLMGGYFRSKLATILHANELSRRLKEEGCDDVTANSLHPGVVITNILRHHKSNVLLMTLSSLAKPFLKSIPQGAATTCYVALHPGAKDKTGIYFKACKASRTAKNGRDEALAKKLWEFGEGILLMKRKQRIKKHF